MCVSTDSGNISRISSPHLRVVRLLNLLLVEEDLILMLCSQICQGTGQLALKLLLAPAVNLHHARLNAALGLTQLL